MTTKTQDSAENIKLRRENHELRQQLAESKRRVAELEAAITSTHNYFVEIDPIVVTDNSRVIELLRCLL